MVVALLPAPSLSVAATPVDKVVAAAAAVLVVAQLLHFAVAAVACQHY